jgi:hypothetical protein
MVEHKIFEFTPTDNADNEVWEEMDIGEKVSKYTEWFRNHHVAPKKYNFKKYVSNNPEYPGMNGTVTVQIFDRKIDTLFRLAWL